MTIILYQNMSEANVMNKTLDNSITVTGTLRGGTSVLNPVIDIESTNVNIVWINYLYIVEWKRYYFVSDIASVRNNLWSFSCHVDVLTTYKAHILKLHAIIARQEFAYNLYLNDDKFLIDAPRMKYTKAFPNRVVPGNAANALSFILTLAGGEQTSA